MATSTSQPRKVHVVGSIPLSTTAETFERLTTSLPHLTRLPDGELGSRGNFIFFQSAIFAECQHVVPPPFRTDPTASISPPSPQTPIKLHPTGYDEYAILSYLEFCRLRTEGVIAPNVRFQVGLPTPLNVVAMFVLPEYQVEVEKLYEESILEALRNIQENIPKEDLAIQWDMPIDVAFMEYAKLQGGDGGKGEVGRWLEDPYGAVVTKPWFGNVKLGVLSRAKKMMSAVDEGVEMGIHLCYGDFTHKHFIEPKDMRVMVELANGLFEGVQRKVNWLHMPVPKGRVDEEFYEPLKELKLRLETELYLGLVHPGDLEGTEERIEAARRFMGEFGVSTECGCGRCSEDDLMSILEISRAVTA